MPVSTPTGTTGSETLEKAELAALCYPDTGSLPPLLQTQLSNKSAL